MLQLVLHLQAPKCTVTVSKDFIKKYMKYQNQHVLIDEITFFPNQLSSLL